MRSFVLLAVALGGIAVGALLVSGTSDEPWRPDEAGPLPVEPTPRPAPPAGIEPVTPPGGGDTPSRPGASPDEVTWAIVLAGVEEDPTSRRTQRELAAFVVSCTRRGDACVAEIAAFLAGGRDVSCDRPWGFEEGELTAYPTVRAACLEALRGVRTPAATTALRAALRTSPGAGDGYLAARALHERGADGWADQALLLARGEETRGDGAALVRPRLVALAAASDPAETARQVYDDATRGGGRRKPQILSAGMQSLPETLATSVGQGLLDDATVTPRAKTACVEGLLRREDPASWQVVGRAVERSGLPEEVRLRAAALAADSPLFGRDERAWRRARREGDVRAAAAIREGYEARLEEAERMVRAVWGSPEPESEDRRAREAFRALERRRHALDD